MANLGTIYLNQGRLLDAQTIITDARVLQAKTLGEKHPDTISSRAHLGVILYADGRYNEAKWVFITVQDLQREVFGEKHPHTLETMARIALCRFHIEPDEARETLVELLRLHKEVYGDEHPYTIKTAADLAACEDRIRGRDGGQMLLLQDSEQTPSRDDEPKRKLELRALREVMYDRVRIFKKWGLQRGDSDK
jgi:hypothetical protein